MIYTNKLRIQTIMIYLNQNSNSSKLFDVLVFPLSDL